MNGMCVASKRCLWLFVWIVCLWFCRYIFRVNYFEIVDSDSIRMLLIQKLNVDGSLMDNQISQRIDFLCCENCYESVINVTNLLIFCNKYLWNLDLDLWNHLLRPLISLSLIRVSDSCRSASILDSPIDVLLSGVCSRSLLVGNPWMVLSSVYRFSCWNFSLKRRKKKEDLIQLLRRIILKLVYKNLVI